MNPATAVLKISRAPKFCIHLESFFANDWSRNGFIQSSCLYKPRFHRFVEISILAIFITSFLFITSLLSVFDAINMIARDGRFQYPKLLLSPYYYDGLNLRKSRVFKFQLHFLITQISLSRLSCLWITYSGFPKDRHTYYISLNKKNFFSRIFKRKYVLICKPIVDTYLAVFYAVRETWLNYWKNTSQKLLNMQIETSYTEIRIRLAFLCKITVIW